MGVKDFGKTKKTYHRLIILFTVLLFIFIALFCFIEIKIRPLIREASKSKARAYATEIISSAVLSALSESEQLVTIEYNNDGVSSIQTNIAELSKLRAVVILDLTDKISKDRFGFSVPLGSLSSSNLIAGVGIPIKIKLVPIGDVYADIRTEFVESGINQTLHKITLRVRITFNVISAGSSVKMELANDISLAETVIVGKVPDAYTAINRFEIDEDEENDLNDYAASIP